jgi:hypothetical protein
MSDLDDIARELRRVVDRLSSAPLTRIEPLLPHCHDVATFLVERTRAIDPHVPIDVPLPAVGATAAGAQLAVVGRDYLAAAERAGVVEADEVLVRLIDLRRQLP